MKRTALHKEFWTSIRKSLGRFLSIFMIVALGVSFFSGIRASEPDMRISGDRYYDETNLMDLKVQGTLGLTDDDVRTLSDVEGIELAEGGFTVDALCQVGENEKVLHIASAYEKINQITVFEGRMPKGEGECLLDEDFMAEGGFEIGDRIYLSSGTDSPVTDSLKQDSLTVVGAGSSPEYISIERGSSLVGNGEVSGFAVVAPEAFSLDVYTEICLLVDGAKAKTCYTDGYDDLIAKVKNRVEGIEDVACARRTNEIREEAFEQIEDSQKQLDEERQKADDELAKAEQELSDGEKGIQDGEKRIADGREALISGKAEISRQEETLKDAETQYENSLSALKSSKSSLRSKQAELEEGKQTAQKRFSEQETKIVQSQKELDEAKQQLDAAEQEIDTQEQALADGRAQLEAKKTEIMTASATLDQIQEEIEAGIAEAEQTIDEQQQKLEALGDQIASGKSQIQSAKNTIAQKERELTEAETELADGRKELDKGRKEYESQKADAESRLADAQSQINDARSDVEKLDEQIWYVNDRDILAEYTSYGENADRMRAIGEVFPELFFLVAALISLTTMTRMVEEERTQIGTMKALGYGKGAIAGKYLMYAFLATMGGSVFGVLIGEKVFPYIIIYSYQIMYTHLPHIVVPYQWNYAAMATAAALACTLLATLYACYKELAAQPAELMRPPSPKEGKRILLERVSILWRHLSFTWKSSVRNLFRYKKRFFMTIAGIGGCMALMVVGFGLRDSIMCIGTIQYQELQVYDGMVYLSNSVTDEEIRTIMNTMDEMGKMDRYMEMEMMKEPIAASADGKTEDVYLCVPEDKDMVDEFMTFRDRTSGEIYHLTDDGVILTEKMAKTLDVSRGDPIYIGVDGEEKEVTVTDICENYMEHYVYMTAELYEELYGEEPGYNSILFDLKNASDKEISDAGETLLKYDGVMNVTYTNNIEDQLNTMLESLNLVIVVLIISAGLLAFVVLYNLNNINITERRRELATLKVLGFYDAEVSSYVYRENIMLTLFSIVIGIGLGAVLHRFVITTVEVDAVMFGRVVNWRSYLYSALFTVGFSLFVNWVMYYKLKKIDMVESLKSVE